MFHKPFKVKTQTAIKGSERKRVRNDIEKLFPNLQPADLLQIIPAKDEMTVAKIYTHSGESLVIYCVQKNPVFIEVFKELIPTIYTVWKFPELLPVFRTYPPVFSKLKSGADLMLPGVIVEGEVTPYTFRNIKKGDLCSVCLLGNKAPVAVGRAALSGSDMFDSAMRGKGVQIVHLFGDDLWSFGDKSPIPVIPDGMLMMNEDSDSDKNEQSSSTKMDQQNGDSKVTKVTGDSGIDSRLNANQSCNSGDNCELDQAMNKCSESLHQLDLKNGSNNTEEEMIDLLDNMDELLDVCFKCAIKSSVKKSDLPLLTSAFFKNHMVKFCPPGKLLDVKKSSYKKLSKFLQKMQKDGYIKVKELSKGADSIVEVDKSQLRDFELPNEIDIDPIQPVTSEAEFVLPKLTEMYSVTSAVLPLFKPNGLRKGSAVAMTDIRSYIDEYVRSNNLQSDSKKSQVQLDPIIADIVLTKGENNVTHLSWEELFKRILSKMQPVLCIEHAGQTPTYQKGKVEGIKLDIQQRASNKKVTLIENIETFGIDPKELAHTVQVGMACSATISTLPQKNKGVQIVIQGNQISYIADLLLNKYKVPRKYINGMEKAPKRR
ncbi:eukaryotic translation initiation factor 2D-like [Mytilus edulis]|uniref:eukaryotic translation initiation factor 2D-like n=1 Tax=Mytilus edulis TaxID=6550 RepID=UPI0039F0A256